MNRALRSKFEMDLADALDRDADLQHLTEEDIDCIFENVVETVIAPLEGEIDDLKDEIRTRNERES